MKQHEKVWGIWGFHRWWFSCPLSYRTHHHDLRTPHPVLKTCYLLGSGFFATGFVTAGALTGASGGGAAAAAASFAALICSILSSLSFCNFTCCSSATFCKSTPEPPALVVFLADFFPFCAPLSAELQKQLQDWVFSAWIWHEKLQW